LDLCSFIAKKEEDVRANDKEKLSGLEHGSTEKSHNEGPPSLPLGTILRYFTGILIAFF
jgi:hypothetical protein